LILLSIGFEVKLIGWIMSCVSIASFAVLINGEVSDYLKIWRGLHQGFPLSPYLFILIMEGLILMLSRGSDDHSLSGIKVIEFLKIIQLMFFDDVLLMSKAYPLDWKVIFDILQDFFLVLGLCINPTNTTVHYWGLEDS
jgi:hypothetical protein